MLDQSMINDSFIYFEVSLISIFLLLERLFFYFVITSFNKYETIYIYILKIQNISNITIS